MDNLFSAYSEKYEEQIRSIEGSVLVSYDTSCLLDLYRCTDGARTEVIELFKRIDSKFGHFIVHHVALEFSVNKEKAKEHTKHTFNALEQNFNKFKQSIQTSAKIGGLTTPLSELSNNISPFIDGIYSEFQKSKKGFSRKNEKEDIFDSIAKLFSGKVSDPFSHEQLQLISNEGTVRFEKKIPPGFEDGSKSNFINFNGVGVESKFGDLIVWKQLIEVAKKRQSNLIFITSEEKDDWIVRGRMRPDLAGEFQFQTNFRIFCMSLKAFERKFGRELGSPLSSVTRTELDNFDKESNSWLEDILNAFKHFEGEASLRELYTYLEANSRRNLPLTWQSTVRRTIYNHSSDVNAYLGRADLFERTSKGEWKLRDA